MGGFGTQTSWAITINQCLPLPGFVNNPCFQTLHYALPEGWTHFQLFRETSTDTVATARLIHEVVMTTPQHASADYAFGFADTRITPINGTVIGAANYNANITGSVAWKCGTTPGVSAYPGYRGKPALIPLAALSTTATQMITGNVHR
jgi:hypothetical protein